MKESVFQHTLTVEIGGESVDIHYSYWVTPADGLYTYQGMHMHEYPEVHWAVNREAVFLIGRERVTVPVGSALIIAPGVPHVCESDAVRGYSFVYHVNESARLTKPLRINGRHRILPSVDCGFMLRIQETPASCVRDRERVRALFKLALLELLGALAPDLPAPAEPMDAAQYGMYIERYISAQINRRGERLYGSKDRLARELAISPRQLERIIRAVFGKTYTELYQSHLFTLAAKLMTDAGWRVKETAEFLGYDNPDSFSRAFKKYFGVPPSQKAECDMN